MFNSVALDVVLGLVFIYLLYSLLATVISELISTALGLRGRNLKGAIDRMLNDEILPENKLKRFWFLLKDTLKISKNPENPVIDAFYNYPEIKYLGSSGFFKIPSNFKSDSFAKTVMHILFGEGRVTRQMIDEKIENLQVFVKDKNNVVEPVNIGNETATYIRNLWSEAQGDVDKFKKELEDWFDKTMEHTIEWYKRKIRVITMIIGLIIAWSFNADTFVIVKILSKDKEAREQIVSMANAYLKSNQYALYNADIQSAKSDTNLLRRMDSLLAVKDQLQADIVRAGSLLGTGFMLPDQVTIIELPTGDPIITPPVEIKFISAIKKCRAKQGKTLAKNDHIPMQTIGTDSSAKKEKKTIIDFTCGNKWHYAFWILYHHFFGFLVTAIAISLGAPFWFDLLSKIMSLKTSKKEPPPEAASDTKPAGTST